MANGKILPYIKAQLHRKLCTRNIFGKRRSFQAAPFLHDTDPCVKVWRIPHKGHGKCQSFLQIKHGGFPVNGIFQAHTEKVFVGMCSFFQSPLFFRCPIPNLYVSFSVLHVQPFKTFTSGISACFGIVFFRTRLKKQFSRIV